MSLLTHTKSDHPSRRFYFKINIRLISVKSCLLFYASLTHINFPHYRKTATQFVQLTVSQKQNFVQQNSFEN